MENRLSASLTSDQKALAEYMSALSGEAYSAAWMRGLEFALWDALQTGPCIYGRVRISSAQLDRLRELSVACGGWVTLDENALPLFVTLDAWQREYVSALGHGSGEPAAPI
jgi:hypothetical protein